LGADATIFGAPAGIVIGAAGLVSIGVGSIILYADNYTAGGRFSPKSKGVISDENKARNDGAEKCDNCGKDVTPGQKLEKGSTRPDNERNYDHKTSRKNGGDNSPGNGSIKCLECNLKKGGMNEDQFKVSPNNPVNQEGNAVYGPVNLNSQVHGPPSPKRSGGSW
jgi:hypothetical protein